MQYGKEQVDFYKISQDRWLSTKLHILPAWPIESTSIYFHGFKLYLRKTYLLNSRNVLKYRTENIFTLIYHWYGKQYSQS